MTVLLWIATVVLVLAMGGIGMMKLVGNEEGIVQAKRLGYDHLRMQIGAAEVAAAGGVVIGAISADLEWLGAAAGVGVILMMIGAAGFHIKAGDKFEILPSIIVTIAAVLYLVALGGN